MLITIFTPTYNRSTYLPVLYNSLISQTYKDIEWVIVDDGSSDNTDDVVENFISENKVNITYYKQSNAGKHIAMNQGARLAKGYLFYVVDSDDFLTPDSVERVLYHWENVQKLSFNERTSIIGIAGNIIYPSGEIVGDNPGYEILDTDLIDYRFNRKIKGDKKEVYLTEIVRANPFPQIPGEKFCPEALVFYRLAEQGYKLRFVNENIYICEYLEGGLSLNGLKTLQRGPIASLQSYADVVKFSGISFSTKLKFALLFWRFSFIDKKQSFFTKSAMLANPIYTLLYPLGYLLHLRDIPKL